MSEIPYVNQLGDAFEKAIAKRARAPRLRRLGRRRYLVAAVAALAVAGGGAAIADMLSDPVDLAAGSVACFSNSNMSGDVAITRNPSRSPVELCAEAQKGSGVAAADLLACRRDRAVVVLPRRGRAGCTALGLAALPRDYKAGRLQVAELQRAVMALERRADCIPPRRLARQVQALLRRSGWTGWRTWLRLDGEIGPCGRVSQPRGDGLREIGGSLDTETHRIMIWGSMPRSLEEILFAPDSVGVRLMDSSGQRCYSLAGLKAHARSMLAPTGRPVSFQLGQLVEGDGIEPPRGDRYVEGCAIVVDSYPVFSESGGTTIKVEIFQREAAG
jgi:hypothetical protein